MSDEKKKEKLVINLDEEKIKAVSDTYSLYTSMEVEAGKKDDKVKKVNRDVDSLKSLKPELQKPIRKILSSVPKDQVKKLINPNEEQKSRLFNKKGSNTFAALSEQEKAILMKKMDNWKVNEEVAEINASVAVSWVNNVGNEPEKADKQQKKDK
ncbi:MAG: hypothetical protein U0457_21390 [Candidatus Sericytochromatia bacterium]